jgi:hypothetical protein
MNDYLHAISWRQVRAMKCCKRANLGLEESGTARPEAIDEVEVRLTNEMCGIWSSLYKRLICGGFKWIYNMSKYGE